MSRSRLFWVVPIIFVVLSSCAITHFADKYQPGATSISLWRKEEIPLDPAWIYWSTVQVPVRGVIWDSNVQPVDQIKTLIFTQGTDAGAALLFLSRVDKTSPLEIFRYLGGTKVEIDGKPYREAHYTLNSNSTDFEYQRYFAALLQDGISLAPEYRVRVLDRLPVDSTLVRIMELFPGQAPVALPSYGRLYPQERYEPLPRRIF